jgi:5-methylcytosine-specific restriction enzyme subunit McrC
MLVWLLRRIPGHYELLESYSMINLFEYQNKVGYSESLNGLDEFLDEIWMNREKSTSYWSEQSDRIESQQFIQFLHKTKQLKSNNYVGVIHFEGKKINLLPKIFYDAEQECSTKEINVIQHHVLWWLSYCKKIKFPSYQTAMGSQKSDFFEVLIFLFAKYTRTLLNNSIYQQYEEINKEIPFIKGRLNVNEYINQNLSKGRWHQLNCTYDAFVFDNKFNRIIKYVTTLLFNASTSWENKKYLREILFLLDEVTDVPATAEECARIEFNPMFGEFEIVRDYCQLFLSNSISFNYKNDLKLFAFLLPMEYVFEDFIFGFIEKEIEEVTAKAQVSKTSLDTEGNFGLRPDLFLQLATKNYIADTKYKIVYSDERDPKKGIAQSDLYQMIAYAIRFRIDKIFLFYPNTLKDTQDGESEIVIKDELADGKTIQIKSYQLPIINRGAFTESHKAEDSLSEMFEETKELLIQRVKAILI